MNVTRILSVAALLAALSLTSAQQSGGETAETESDEGSVSMADVPVNVMMAAMAVAAAEGYEIQQVNTEVERDGRLNYEFGGDGFEIDITADEAMLDEVEVVIPLEELPEAVRNTLTQLLGDFQPTTVETSTRPLGVVVYEFEGQLGERNVDIELSADAEVMLINLD